MAVSETSRSRPCACRPAPTRFTGPGPGRPTSREPAPPFPAPAIPRLADLHIEALLRGELREARLDRREPVVHPWRTPGTADAFARLDERFGVRHAATFSTTYLDEPLEIVSRKVQAAGEEAALACGSIAGGARTAGGRCGDIRIPPGVTVDRVKAELTAAIDPFPDVSWRILECTEPSWTDLKEEIVRAVQFKELKCKNCVESAS